MEVWRNIPSLPGYQASDQGRIRSMFRTIRDSRGRQYTRPPKVRALSVAGNGYLRFNARGTQRSIHRCVLEAFVGPCPEGYHGAHGDGDKTNNRLTNLRWASPAENAADKVSHGTMFSPAGEKNPNAIVTAAQVLDVVARVRAGETQRSIARELGVMPQLINSIMRGKAWNSVTGLPPTRSYGKVA
jgi:hypothetical protein